MHMVLPEQKARLVLAILAILAMLVVVNQFTGLITNIMKIDLSVAPSVQGNVYIIDVPGTIMENEQAEFVFALDNIGTTLLDGRVHVEIRDSLNSTVDSFSSNPYSVQPGSYITYTAQWHGTTRATPLTSITQHLSSDAWQGHTGASGAREGFVQQGRHGTL